MKHWFNVLLLFFVVISSHSTAEQLAFSRQKKEQGYQFNYRWLDAQQQTQQMSFILSKEAVFDRFRHFKAFKAESAEGHIKKSILKNWRKEPIKDAQLQLTKQGKQYQLSVKARSQTQLELAQKKVTMLEHEASQEYLRKNYYHSFMTVDSINAIKPDHSRIAATSVDDFKVIKPIILNTVSIKNVRQVTNYVLNFVQAIPYSPLESRSTSSGVGFNPPTKLLWENQGDCDSKVTLTAALLRALMPRIKIALIFIDGHALIGIGVAGNAGETTVVNNGIKYVLAEPTGPASYLLGSIAPESKAAIDNNLYVLEPFNAN